MFNIKYKKIILSFILFSTIGICFEINMSSKKIYNNHFDEIIAISDDEDSNFDLEYQEEVSKEELKEKAKTQSKEEKYIEKEKPYQKKFDMNYDMPNTQGFISHPSHLNYESGCKGKVQKKSDFIKNNKQLQNDNITLTNALKNEKNKSKQKEDELKKLEQSTKKQKTIAKICCFICSLTHATFVVIVIKNSSDKSASNPMA